MDMTVRQILLLILSIPFASCCRQGRMYAYEADTGKLFFVLTADTAEMMQPILIGPVNMDSIVLSGFKRDAGRIGLMETVPVSCALRLEGGAPAALSSVDSLSILCVNEAIYLCHFDPLSIPDTAGLQMLLPLAGNKLSSVFLNKHRVFYQLSFRFRKKLTEALPCSIAFHYKIRLQERAR